MQAEITQYHVLKVGALDRTDQPCAHALPGHNSSYDHYLGGGDGDPMRYHLDICVTQKVKTYQTSLHEGELTQGLEGAFEHAVVCKQDWLS